MLLPDHIPGGICAVRMPLNPVGRRPVNHKAGPGGWNYHQTSA